MQGERVWLTDQQHVTINVLGMISAIGTELSKRVARGEEITYSHFMAYLAEEVTREIPPGTHFLRNALDSANAARKAEQAAWELGRESGFFSQPCIRS